MLDRFVLIILRNVRFHEFHMRQQSVDTRFSVPIASKRAVVFAIAFADVAPGWGQIVQGDADDSEASRLERARLRLK